MSDFSNKIKKYTELFQEIKKNTKQQFSSLFTEFFIKYSDIKSITFYAYANYFSDGDASPFYIRTDKYDVVLVNGKRGKIYEEYYEEDEETLLEEKLSFAIHEEFSNILNSIPDEIIESSFGSDVEITVHRDGRVESEHYGNHN